MYFKGRALFLAVFFSSFGVNALPSTNCLKVKIFSKNNIVTFKERERFVVHFQLENCGNENLPLDFYGNIGYPKDSSCNIYFELYRSDSGKNNYTPYDYITTDYKNMVDSIIQLKPRKIYTFYLPLFVLFDIKEPGYYRIQGFYRFKTNTGDYFIKNSDYYYIIVK